MIARHIGGTGRTGTAILGGCLALHPDAVYFREPRFICDPGGLYDYLVGKVNADQFKTIILDKFLRNLTTKLKTMETAELVDEFYNRDTVFAIGEDTLIGGPDRFIEGREFIEQLFGQLDRRYWIEKTPHTVRRVDLLYRMFGDDLRYVHLIREPKDIFASLIHQRWGPKKPETFIRWYREIMHDAQISWAQVPRDCYLVLRMETLVQKPHDVFAQVLRFFEIDYDVYWLHQTASGVTKKQAHVGRYEHDLSCRARVMIDQDCGNIYRWWKDKEVQS